MTYNAFADLDPLNEEYGSKDSFNSSSDTNVPKTSFDRNNPFADLDPLFGTPVNNGVLAPVVQPEAITPVAETPQNQIGQFDLIDVSPDKQGWGELGGWKNLEDGSVSTELTITVKHPELNQGMPTVIPTLVAGQENIDGLLSFNITDQHEEIAVKRAIQRQNDGMTWPSFETIPEADKFAEARSSNKPTESDSPNSAVTDFILRDENTFAGRVNRGIAERASTLGGGLVRFVGQSADELGDWLEERVPLGVVDISADGISWRPSTKEDIAQPSFLLPLARDMESADFGYKEGTTWEEVKNEPLANILPWALETGLVSAPDMAAAIVALPAYIAARTGEMGQNRAENKGEKDATFQEFLEVLPASVFSAIIERIGVSKVFGISTPVQSIAEVPKEIAKRVITDSAVEGIQEPLEYAAETIGTNVAFEPAVAAERALQGALSGAVTASTLAPLTIPGELALADAKKTDGGPQANSDGSFGTPTPALISPNANTEGWGIFPNVGGSYSVLNPATGENAGTFDSEQEAELAYQSKVVETPPQKTEPAIPDAPTSAAPDIAEVEVGINAQRAELDNDLAKIMAALDAPLTSSVPPTTDLIAQTPTIVSIPKDEPEVDPLAITAEDMAQIDIDTAAYEASIAATNTELPPTLPALTPETVELAPESPELLPESFELAPEFPVIPVEPVKKKYQSESQKAAQRKEIDPTKDDLLVAIAKLGGVTRTEASSEGFDTPDFKLRKGFGGQVVFRAKAEEGRSFDAMREALSQYGYIDANSTVNDFADLLQKAVRGETVVSTANEANLANVDAARDEDFIAQGGEIQAAQAPVKPQDQNLTSALEEARTLGLPESEIDSILTNYPKESEAVLQLQMSMGDIELGDSSVTTNQAARVGDLRPERNVPKSAGDQGLAGQYTNDGTGPSDNGTQNGTDEVGVLLSPSATSGDPIADSEAGSGGGSDSAGLSGTNARETVSLDGTMLPTERRRIETKLSAMSTKDFATTLKNTGLLKTGTKESKIKRMVDAREGAQAMAQFDSLEAFIEAVNDTPKWQDALSKTTISKSDLLRWTNATKMKGDLYSREGVLENAANLYDWATASGALNIPRTSEKSQYEGESSMQASARATDERIKASKKATESYSHFSRLEDPSLTQEQIQTNYEAMVAGEDKRIVQAEKDSKAADSVDTETQSEETSVDFLQTVRMGLMNKMKAPQAKFYLKRGSFPEPSAARMNELITKAGYMGASSQGPDFALISATSPSYQALGIEEYTESEQIWVQVKLLADKKLRYRGDFLYPTDSFIEEVANNKANLETQTEESFDLETQTEESLAADTEQAATASTEQAAKTKTLSDRAKADAEVGGFLLTGSDAAADVAAANGQDDMFNADTNATGQDNTNGKPLFSKSAILAPNAKPKGVTKAQIQARVDVFLAKYKGADDVRVWVRDTQDNAFGPGSTAKDGRIKGGYYPEQDAVVFIAENIDSVQEIDSTIQHELLVHKGLGLFEAKDVKGLIDVINENAANSKTLKDAWAEVQDKYKKETLEVQAEELLARVAEKKMSKPDKYWNKIVTYIRDMLRKIGFVKEISFSDLRKRVYDMGAAFAEGRRAQTREGYESKTNTKSPSSDGLSGSGVLFSKKGGMTPGEPLLEGSNRPDVKAKVEKGTGKPDLTLYGVNADGQRVLVAKPRDGGWDIVVDRRVDGEMFTNGKPREYTAKTRKGVEARIEMLGLELEEVINTFPPAQADVLSGAETFSVTDATWLDKARFHFQDRFVSAAKVQAEIEKFTAEQLEEDMDFYGSETLKHGITTAQITNFNDTFIEPIFDVMYKNDLSIDDVSNYLYARHAEEANAAMKEKNAAFEDNESKSGMSDEDAAKIIADFKASGKMDALNGIAAATDKVIERTRQILVETGLLSEETVQGYRDQYDYYVPLLGDPMDPEGKIKRVQEDKRFGRNSRADNVLINLIVQHEQTIIRGENNVLKRVLLNLVEKNPNPDFWTIDKTEDEKVLDPVTDLFVLKKTPNTRLGKHVVAVRVAGEEHQIVFEQTNDHAMMLATSMNNLNAKEVNSVVQAGLKLNRYISMINTQYNLEFMPTNVARDIQTALINVYQYDDVDHDMVMRITKNVKKSIKGIRDHQKGRKDSEESIWYEEFYKGGAQTGWLDSYDTMASRARQLETIMARKKYMPLDVAHRLIDYISDLNTSYENGVRLATYIELRKAGYSVHKASLVAKNLTVNFNRRGDKTLLAGSLYVFFNASMQGNAAIIQAAQSKAVRKAMLAVFGMQVAVEMWNRLMGGEDEDGQSIYSKIPQYVRDNNWVFMLPDFGGDTDAARRLYIKIPLSYGYNVINVGAQVTGAAASQLLGNRDVDGLDAGIGLTRMMGALIHGFNPVGSDASVIQALSPTAGDPFLQAKSNENFSGAPIRPDQMPFGPPKPESQLFWSRTPEHVKSIASTLNEISGGTDIRPGSVDISPEIIEHYYSFFTGGAGRFFTDMVTTPAMIATDQKTELRDYPWLRKFVGQVGNRTDVDNYYKATTDITYAQRALDAAKVSSEDGLEAEAAVDKVIAEEGYKLSLSDQAEAANNFITSKRAEKASYEADLDIDAKRKKTLMEGVDREIRKRRTTFVSMYRAALDREARFN